MANDSVNADKNVTHTQTNDDVEGNLKSFNQNRLPIVEFIHEQTNTRAHVSTTNEIVDKPDVVVASKTGWKFL